VLSKESKDYSFEEVFYELLSGEEIEDDTVKEVDCRMLSN